MYQKILQEFGFTNSEIAVYQALIKLKSSTTGPIVKQAHISSGKIYEILDKLIEKGLVTYITKAGRKYFHVTNPQRFYDYVEKKEQVLQNTKQQLQGMISHFQQTLEKKEETQTAEIFEGKEGFKTFSEFCLNTLKKDTDYCILGVSKEVNDLFGAYLLDWQKRRTAKGVSLRIMYDEDAKGHAKKREKLKLTQVRYLPQYMKTPALIEIFEDYVATVIIVPTPIVFLIKSKEAAQSYLTYFNMVWKQAKPLKTT